MNGAAFEHRSLVLRLAYDITGSWAAAEDVAQSVALRWLTASGVREERAYVARMAVNAALDVVARREYTGPVLPGPVPTGPGVDEIVEQASEVEFALARVLQSLSPLERTAFLLHDVFGFSYAEVGAMLNRSPEAMRQLGSRPRRHVQEDRSRFRAEPAQVRALAERFFAAARAGDVDGLRALLTADVSLVADGGGRASAAVRPIRTADAVARYVVGLAEKALQGVRVEEIVANGQQAWLLRRSDDVVDQVMWLASADGNAIAEIATVRDPRKLAALRA
ncbi:MULTISPECIES: sigma factor-like helix-turn-helix DNA-binding protein [Kocuria]|uniref:SnoaL-like domain-containing protein n=1 Tax=Kocuria subflava TaxID=1736139 RepID=A0A846U7B2_9MICC|nr:MULTISPECIES: sigma factor-like helix-turn-helix DNA-binding protein [Kocuria]NKE10681.1 SnoaL-like domain-containing protein [Kocuria subflava]